MELKFYKDASDKWRWRVTADNGKIVGSSSQGFASKQMAGENTELLKNALTDCNNGGG